MPPYTVVIPVLNDSLALGRLLESLVIGGVQSAPIVVDGGSEDDSVAVAKRANCRVLTAAPGRASQLRCGVAAADTDWIWMLHADSLVSGRVVQALIEATTEPGWGRFDVQLPGDEWPLRMVAWWMNTRSRWTGIATGDQGIFVHQTLLRAAGGIPDQPLMEDIELSKRLKRIARPRCLRARVVTSARRWQKHGVVRTILLMWLLRLAYFSGVSPARLHRIYYRGYRGHRGLTPTTTNRNGN
jgi:rSAM/selenodomain-associated transferase 2